MAYGRDNLTVETKQAILFGQQQAELSYRIAVEVSIAVATGYPGLCTTAKGEEKQIAELGCHIQYYRCSRPPQNAKHVEKQLAQPHPEGNTSYQRNNVIYVVTPSIWLTSAPKRMSFWKLFMEKHKQ